MCVAVIIRLAVVFLGSKWPKNWFFDLAWNPLKWPLNVILVAKSCSKRHFRPRYVFVEKNNFFVKNSTSAKQSKMELFRKNFLSWFQKNKKKSFFFSKVVVLTAFIWKILFHDFQKLTLFKIFYSFFCLIVWH